MIECPFCDSTRILINRRESNDEASDKIFVSCETCGARTRGSVSYHNGYFKSNIEDVINEEVKLWETRGGKKPS